MSDPHDVDQDPRGHSDVLQILPAWKGSGLEPEEAPARRVIANTATLQLAPSLPEVETRAGRPALRFDGSESIGRINTPITTEGTAGEFATALRTRCLRCTHFRRDLWRATKKVWASAPEGSSRKVGLDAMVMQIARAVTDAPPTLKDLKLAEISLNSWGVCEALSEERIDLVVVHPDACCPEGVHYYRDASREARREASQVFDTIMRKAQGKL